MKKLYYNANSNKIYYENGSEILTNGGNGKYYDLIEVEIFKISFI